MGRKPTEIFAQDVELPKDSGTTLIAGHELIESIMYTYCCRTIACYHRHQEPYNPKPYLLQFRKYPAVASGLGADYFFRDGQRSNLTPGYSDNPLQAP